MTDAPPMPLQSLPELVGRRGAPRPAKFPVNEAMIGLWCDAVGDDNPAYQDPQWARASRWGGIVAPATTLNMWTLPGYRRIHPPGEPLDDVTAALNAAGFTSVAAVNNDHVYRRPLRPGDRLSQVQHLRAVSGPKRTRLGVGYFFDIVSEFLTDEGELVGEAMMRIFKWAPEPRAASAATELKAADGAEQAESASAAQAPGRRDPRGTVAWGELQAGMSLPRWREPLTATRIIALAAATLDYNDVHFERAAAVRAGADDIYMNILGSSGLMNRYLTDWAGPEAGLRAARIRLQGQNHPGDTAVFTGVINSVAVAPDNDDLGLVEVAVQAVNERGPHLAATVTVELPR